MEYKIRQDDSGLFEVVQVMPILLGTFPERVVAEKFLTFLAEDGFEVEDEPEEQVPSQVTLKPEPEPFKPLSTAAPVEPRKDAAAADADWTADEAEEAIQRLKNGEKIKDVAASFGRSWVALRARWAGHQARQKKAVTTANLPAVTGGNPLTTVKAAVAELQDQPECALCGRHFTVTPENQDRCARCADANR